MTPTAVTNRPKYKRPPIIEAIISIQYEASIDAGIIRRAKDSFEKEFPSLVDHNHFNFHVNQGNVISGNVLLEGFTRSNHITGLNVILRPNEFAVTQQAPYECWEKFFDAFVGVWKKLKKDLPKGRTKRLGLRYINRIDIPLPEDSNSISVSDYLKFGIHVPQPLMPTNYSATAVIPINKFIKCNVVTANTDSPIFNHTGILLDIDMYNEVDVPQKEDEISEMLHQLRDEKNCLFTQLITENTEKLFHRMHL